MIKETPMWWDGINWIIQVPFTVEQRMLRPAIDYMIKVQKQRFLSLKPGPGRDDLVNSIAALKQGKVLQQPTRNQDGYARIFASTPAVGDRIISLGGSHG